MQSLDGAYQRVKRAGVHLTNLNRRVDILSRKIHDNVIIKRTPTAFILPDGRKVNGVLGEAKFPFEPVPDIVKILVGEIIYNLRASLDYLVYELARLDSGKIIDGTQFPIEDKKEVFWGRHRSYVKGLSDKHIAMVEVLQPYNGCNWTRTLRELSNPDKHRQLTMPFVLTALSIPQGSTEAIIVGQPVDMNDGISIYIKFRERTSVIDRATLKQLKTEVTKTLDAFNSECK
jgi:hypothetical protein